MESGDEVFIDARSVGLSSDAAGGLLLEGVPAGEHDVLIVTPTGARTNFKLNVFDGQMTTITLSSLGLRGGKRRGEDSTVELQTPITESSRCELAVGSAQLAGAKDDLRIEHLSPGKYHVTVTCGSRAAGADVDIPAGTITTVAADFVAGKLKVADQRARVTNMAVASPSDLIMKFDLPLTWRRAIIAALVPGIHVEAATRDRGMITIASVTTPNRMTMYDFLSRLERMDAINTVWVAGSSPIADGLRVRLYIKFRSE